jgi:hypothetical protein
MLKITAFRIFPPCSLGGQRRLNETYSLHFRLQLPLAVKMEEAIYSGKGGIHLQDNFCQNPKSCSMNTQHREKLNVYVGQDGA